MAREGDYVPQPLAPLRRPTPTSDAPSSSINTPSLSSPTHTGAASTTGTPGAVKPVHRRVNSLYNTASSASSRSLSSTASAGGATSPSRTTNGAAALSPAGSVRRAVQAAQEHSAGTAASPTNGRASPQQYSPIQRVDSLSSTASSSSSSNNNNGSTLSSNGTSSSTSSRWSHQSHKRSMTLPSLAEQQHTSTLPRSQATSFADLNGAGLGISSLTLSETEEEEHAATNGHSNGKHHGGEAIPKPSQPGNGRIGVPPSASQHFSSSAGLAEQHDEVAGLQGRMRLSRPTSTSLANGSSSQHGAVSPPVPPSAVFNSSHHHSHRPGSSATGSLNGFPSGGALGGHKRALSLRTNGPSSPVRNGTAKFEQHASSGSPHASPRLAGNAPGASSPFDQGTASSRGAFAGTGVGNTAKQIEVERKHLIAQEYLTHVAEVRAWLELHIPKRSADDESLWAGVATSHEFEQSLRDGYALARLARALGKKDCSLCQARIYNAPGHLEYRHIDNINIFFHFLQEVRLADTYRFETSDLYSGKNLPKVVFCIYALADLLARRGEADRITDLRGQLEFDDAELDAKQKEFDKGLLTMPNFASVGGPPQRKRTPPPEERLAAALEPVVEDLQANIRGVVARQRYIAQLQAAEEREKERVERAIRTAESLMPSFQACARGALARRALDTRLAALDEQSLEVARLQAHCRGVLARKAFFDHVRAVCAEIDTWVEVQSAVRGVLARKRLLGHVLDLRGAETHMPAFQAACRGVLARRQHDRLLRALARAERPTVALQAACRGALARAKVQHALDSIDVMAVVGVQAHIRGVLARNSYFDWLEHLVRNEPAATALQALVRGLLGRRRFLARRKHYQDHIEKVKRVQALARTRVQAREYRQLRVGKNVPVSAVKNFVRLLDETEGDYNAEEELEHKRRELARVIRDTQSFEDRVKELDMKIALLVKNKITAEVVRAVNHRSGASISFSGRSGDQILAAHGDPFAHAATPDKETERKLERYQFMIYLLQTRPEYFARLFARASSGEGFSEHTASSWSDKDVKALEGLVMTIYGHAQAMREEYLLLKLFQRSIAEEVAHLQDVSEFTRQNFTFIRVVVEYARRADGRRYLRGLLLPLVNGIMARHALDLGGRPLTIYRDETNREELRTGRPSTRPDVETDADAIKDDVTRARFIKQLQALRGETHKFIEALTQSTRALPYGFRLIAREVYDQLAARFPHEQPAVILRVVGHLVFYRFIQPAIIAPEKWDVLEDVVPPLQRTNLGEVAKMLNQISVGREFGQDNPYLVALNEFVRHSSELFSAWIAEVIQVPSPEQHFRANRYLDATTTNPLMLWVSPNDIYYAHSLVLRNLDVVAPEREDALRNVVMELGPPPSSSSDELQRARAAEVGLQLRTRFETEDEESALHRHLLTQTKQFVAAVLKVQHGEDLESVLVKDVTQKDEDTWHQLITEETRRADERATRSRIIAKRQAGPRQELKSMTFRELKMRTLQNVVQLRNLGLVSREDRYQRIIDDIVQDIKNKNDRRTERNAELQTIRATLNSLAVKRRYLEDQIKSYNTYINESMASIQKKSKRRLVLPWSLQGAHQRELEREGKRYRFGSYKYTAHALYERGILLSIAQYSPRQFDRITLTISSDEVGVFEINAVALGVTVATVELKLDELLEAQFEGRQTILLGDVAKANLNLLIHLINRKFYA